MTQKETDNFYMSVAELTAKNSKAQRLQVGAIIVKDKQIISEGYNGTPSGFDNCCENLICERDFVNGTKQVYSPLEDKMVEVVCKGICQIGPNGLCQHATLKTKPQVIHAEANAICKCSKNGFGSNHGTIYITHTPCTECAKLIIQSGIDRVVYRHLYRDLSGVELLNKAGVEVEKIEENDN